MFLIKAFKEHYFALAALFLGALFFVSWGFAMGRYKVFPFKMIKPYYHEIRAFLKGHPEEETSLSEKLLSDFGGVPKRFLYSNEDFSPGIATYEDTSHSTGLFKSNRASPKFFSNSQSGYYLVYGVFEFAYARYGALLIDSSGNIIRTWKFHQINEILNPVKGGFDYSTGTLISNLSNALQAQDFCGNELWRVTDVLSHHSIEPTDTGYFWNFDILFFEKRNVKDGAVVERFSIFDIIEANPDLHVLEPRLKDNWKIENLGKSNNAVMEKEQELPLIGLDDPFHFNDITPLTESVSDKFPAFETSDLLISVRSLNLVFILRPSTKKILWYRMGITSLQHDPDFNSDGSISIFDNNVHNQFSRIVALNVSTDSTSVLLDGEHFGFFNDKHGNHQILNDSSIVFVDYKGRVIHTDKEGKAVFSFLNSFDQNTNLELRNVWYLIDSDFRRLNNLCGS